MNINSDLNLNKTAFIYQSIEEVYRFIEELEQQAKVDIDRFKQEIETKELTIPEAQIFSKIDPL